jgi:2-polyprenyl-3-methyl-5-hydroxy-6-metoxy-1,4-benzoquinol methylase
MKVLRSIDELDVELACVEEAAKVSDDAMRAELASFEFMPKTLERILDHFLPLDPYSESYRIRQFELYSKISGNSSYDPVQNERSEFNVSDALRNPYPFCTKSPQTVGDQLIAIGFIIKTLNLIPPARILEFGPGWGNLTIELARMGYSVTAVDIEPRFIDLIQRRAAQLDLPLRAICGSFGKIPGEQDLFDAILFFECFHHCGDHLGLLRDIKPLLSDQGFLLFAAEPITESFPLPWGVRMDGMSVWSIRKFKWLELGFKESYFVRTLLKLGWDVQKINYNNSLLNTIFLAKKNLGVINISTHLMPCDESSTWAPAETDPSIGVRFTSGNSKITLDEDPQWVSCDIEMTNFAPFHMAVTLLCGTSKKTQDLSPNSNYVVSLALPKSIRLLKIKCKSWSPKDLAINDDTRTLGIAIRRIIYKM